MRHITCALFEVTKPPKFRPKRHGCQYQEGAFCDVPTISTYSTLRPLICKSLAKGLTHQCVSWYCRSANLSSRISSFHGALHYGSVFLWFCCMESNSAVTRFRSCKRNKTVDSPISAAGNRPNKHYTGRNPPGWRRRRGRVRRRDLQLEVGVSGAQKLRAPLPGKAAVMATIPSARSAVTGLIDQTDRPVWSDRSGQPLPYPWNKEFLRLRLSRLP